MGGGGDRTKGGDGVAKGGHSAQAYNSGSGGTEVLGGSRGKHGLRRGLGLVMSCSGRLGELQGGGSTAWLHGGGEIKMRVGIGRG